MVSASQLQKHLISERGAGVETPLTPKWHMAGGPTGAVGKAAHDLRQQFIQELRREVRNTVAEDDDVEEELRYLASLCVKS